MVSKLRKIKLDRGQHIRRANCLKGSYVGYYAAAYGLTMGEAEALEKLWRTAFVFRRRRSGRAGRFLIPYSLLPRNYGGGAGDAIGFSVRHQGELLGSVNQRTNMCSYHICTHRGGKQRTSR